MDAPFPDTANAGPELDAALARSRETGEPLILVFGANWCPDAVALARFLDALGDKLEGRAQVLLIDVGRHDRNQHLVRRYALGRKLEGVPAVLVLDAAGEVLNGDDVYRWRTARSSEPRAVADWLDPLLASAGDRA